MADGTAAKVIYQLTKFVRLVAVVQVLHERRPQARKARRDEERCAHLAAST